MVSKALQKVTSDLQSSMDLRFLENMRSEEGLNNVIMDAKELAEKVGVVAEFEKETQVRPRKIKRIYPMRLKINLFRLGELLDTEVSSLKERFELMENHSKSFQCLYDIEHLQTRDRKELKDDCTHLHDGEECDTNGIELFDELQIFAPILTLLEALQLKPFRS
ncbi:hypothetical protein PR048_001943 [Dryococelus australis]|uniref:Uncharacterized protein n=1 Tax=Dryococelus australis TaxID=614101 RepID=A0ABQ9IIR3_9NEOP|nr:hypothetical protein PR048_001943 [Dryococelus australis]